MRICLIGATHPCHNPRLVREADSLTEAGMEVRVVAPSFVAELAPRDQRLMARRGWELESVDFRPVGVLGRLRFASVRARSRAARSVFDWTGWTGTAGRAYQLAHAELSRIAARRPADWFVAHAHGALPPAAECAKRHGANLGFDCEDLLTLSPIEPTAVVRAIEARHIEACDYVSTPSDEIAAWLARQYADVRPVTLYNVFPVALAEGLKPPPDRPRSPRLRMHWFGQVVGPGRGLEEAAAAAAMLGDSVELHLRGWTTPDFREKLVRLSAPARVHFHDLVDHDEVIRTMDRFDVGLVMERPDNLCYARTVTNKFFSYLLAGLAVASTDTPGQREILGKAPGVGFLFEAGRPRALADGLAAWSQDWESLRAAQTTAWKLARQRFCWDLEKDLLLARLNATAATSPGGTS